MSRFAKLFAANAIAVAGLGSAAIAASASAAADPVAPPVAPGVPALSMIEGLASPASVGAVLQTAASALNSASTLVGAPAPSTLPVSPIAVPGAVPAAPAPAAIGLGSTVAPLLSQLGLPGQLAALAPAGLPLIGANTGAVPAYPAYPGAAPIAPVSPIAPLAPVAPVNPLLGALP